MVASSRQNGVNSLYKNVYSLWFFIASFEIIFLDVDCTSPAEIDRHLQMGVQMLARGQLQDALSHFHAAIDGDPNNYMSYYRRATVYLALGKFRNGLQDLDEVIKLKPDFLSAIVQRASVYIKLGRLDEAYVDLEKVLYKDDSLEEAKKHLSRIEPLREKFIYVQSLMYGHNFREAIELIKEIIEDCPWSLSLRESRMECYESLGDMMSAISDLRAITKLSQDNTDAFYKLSNLYYRTGDIEQSLNEIRECLKLDPDHKQCFGFYKKVKKIKKLLENAQEYERNKEYRDCADSNKKVLLEENMEPEVRYLAFEQLCVCEGDAGEPLDALDACNEALRIKEEPKLYCDRAEVHILNEQYDEAISDFQKALNLDEHMHRAQEGVEKAKRLQKQASKRDYYKILGVKRSATKKEIHKAYRSLAQKWHPDHFEGKEKEDAEKKFIDIAAAKEVLTDEEMRAKFDQGEDPLDPEQQQWGPGGGFNPFQQFHFRQGGFPGGFGNGGPFQFKFHFN